VMADTTAVTLAREDPRAVKLRENIFTAIRGVVELWSVDVEISHVRFFFSSFSLCFFSEYMRLYA